MSNIHYNNSQDNPNNNSNPHNPNSNPINNSNSYNANIPNKSGDEVSANSQVPSYMNNTNYRINELIDKEQIVESNTSLSLQIFIYYDALYSLFYFICQLLLFIYKGFVFPYPPQSIGPEFIGFVFSIIIQVYRLILCAEGNKTEDSSKLVFSSILAAPVLLGYVFLLRLQTYVLVFDFGLNIFSIGFIIMEVMFSLLAITKFKED